MSSRVYLVADYDGRSVGLFSSLEKAIPTYIQTYDAIDPHHEKELFDTYGEDWRHHINYPPQIELHDVDGCCLDIFDNYEELKAQLRS